MTNYKINRNKPTLTDEQIERHKDLNKILNTHQKILKYKDSTRPLYKNPGFMGFMILLGVVLLVFVITERESEQEKQQRKDSTEKITPTSTDSVVNTQVAPSESNETILPNRTIVTESGKTSTASIPEIPFTSFKIDPAKGAVVYQGSTRILIPPFAFANAAGGVVKNEVTVQYREFRDPAEIYLAGIPMHYDSSKKELQLVSAGMFEIRGFSGNTPVTIKEPITVELAGRDHKNYNAYYFNESTRNWEFISKEKKSMRFVFEADEKAFPEMRPFKDIIWEFAINDQQKNPDEFKFIFSKTWSKFMLNENVYKANANSLQLKQSTSTPQFLAKPAALTNDKALNEKYIQAKYDEYFQLLKVNEKNEKLIEEARRKQNEWLQTAQGKEYQNWLKTPEGQRQILSTGIVSIFSVNKFGIWNCDTPSQYPTGASIELTYLDHEGKTLDIPYVYLADYKVNSVYSYTKGQLVKFNPQSENVLWAPLPDGKLGIFPNQGIKSLKKSGKQTIQLKIIDIKGKTVNDIKGLLAMNNHIVTKQEQTDKSSVGKYDRKVVLRKEVRESDVFYRSDTTIINSNGRQTSDQDRLKKEAEEKLKNGLKGFKIK